MDEAKAVAMIAQQMASQQPKSRAYHRIAATRQAAGGKPPKAAVLDESAVNVGSSTRSTKVDVEPVKVVPVSRASETHSVVEWSSDKYAVVEAAGTVTVQVRREGGLKQPVSLKYESVDGTAKAGEDFEKAEGTIEFAPGQSTFDITIKIFDDDEIEPDEVFTIELREIINGDASLGDTHTTQVTVINDDFPGTFVLPEEDVKIKENVGVYMLEVHRVQGCSGAVSMKYNTINGTALAGKNYDASEGVLEWAHQDVKPKFIPITITDDEVMQGNLYFEVEIHTAVGGAVFDEKTDGSKDKSLARVTIQDDDSVKGIAERAINLLGFSQQTVNMGASSWKDQWVNAFSVVAPDDDDENDGEAAAPAANEAKGGIMGHSVGQWVLHILTFPFKLACAIIPPTNISGGLPCFCMAIVVIGALTALIGDVANLLGCSLGIKNSVVAITFVALGTSLPDTFASMSAAQGDATADAAIGNVTGSNAVNVFLGLGLSWTLGAVYWLNVGVTAEWMVRYPQIVDLYQARGTPITIGSKIGLAVPSGDLALGVIVFSINAIICITVLLVRRLFFGGELGSRMRYPTAAFFVLLVRVRRIEASRPRPPCPRPHKPGLCFFSPPPLPCLHRFAFACVALGLRVSPRSVSLRAPCLSALRVSAPPASSLFAVVYLRGDCDDCGLQQRLEVQNVTPPRHSTLQIALLCPVADLRRHLYFEGIQADIGAPSQVRLWVY